MIALVGASLDPLVLAKAIRRAGFTPRELAFEGVGRLDRREESVLFSPHGGQTLLLDPKTLGQLEDGSYDGDYRVLAIWGGEAPAEPAPPAAIKEIKPAAKTEPHPSRHKPGDPEHGIISNRLHGWNFFS